MITRRCFLFNLNANAWKPRCLLNNRVIIIPIPLSMYSNIGLENESIKGSNYVKWWFLWQHF